MSRVSRSQSRRVPIPLAEKPAVSDDRAMEYTPFRAGHGHPGRH